VHTQLALKSTDRALQNLERILGQRIPGLQPLLLRLQPHHAAVLQAQHSASAAATQAPVIQHLLAMSAAANIDQLQELLLRLLQLAAGRNSSSLAEGAAVALHCLSYHAGPHTCYVGAILTQPRSQELLLAACRKSSSTSSIVRAAAAGILDKTMDDLLLPALQAPPEQVGCLGTANTTIFGL
jgi:hypothetical protein